MLKNPVRKLSVLMLAAVLMLTSLSCTCYAATAAVTKTVREVSDLIDPSKINKKATKVKLGSTNLKFKQGYIKFTAPKKGSYQFSFSDLSGDVASAGFFFYRVKTTKKTNLLKRKQVFTEGGKTYIVRICHKEAVDKYYDDGTSSDSSSSSSSKKKTIPSTKVTTLSYLASRTAKLTLKKKQTIYIYMEYFQYIENGDSWGTVNLAINRI